VLCRDIYSRGSACREKIETPRLRDCGAARSSGGGKLAGAQLLEPVMAVEVVTPKESLSTVIGDLNSWRGQVLNINERGSSKVVDAHAPLNALFGYVARLRGLSRRRANATMHFAQSAAVPPAIAQRIAK
jgi:elongation factor G